jgi:hypothetical protein
MPTDLSSKIRDALLDGDITAEQLVHPTLREPRPRRSPRLAAAAAAVAAVVTVAVLVSVLLPGPEGHRETGGDSLAGVVGDRWQVTQVLDAQGTLSVPNSLRAEVGFTRDSYVLGDDTVNALQGNYEPTSNGYSLRNAGSTLVGTSGTDPVRERIRQAVDAVFFTVNPPGQTQTPPLLIVEVNLAGDTLTLQHDGTTLTLERAGLQPDFFSQPASPTPTPTPTPTRSPTATH